MAPAYIQIPGRQPAPGYSHRPPAASRLQSPGSSPGGSIVSCPGGHGQLLPPGRSGPVDPSVGPGGPGGPGGPCGPGGPGVPPPGDLFSKSKESICRYICDGKGTYSMRLNAWSCPADSTMKWAYPSERPRVV